MKTPTTERPSVYFTKDDFTRLSALAKLASNGNPSNGKSTLHDELARATVVSDDSMPEDAVTMNSRVRFEDIDNGEIEEYLITWPKYADVALKRVSILAPIGTALIGFRKGDAVSWPTPGGTRRLKIIAVEHVDEGSFAPAESDLLSRLLKSWSLGRIDGGSGGPRPAT